MRELTTLELEQVSGGWNFWNDLVGASTIGALMGGITGMDKGTYIGGGYGGGLLGLGLIGSLVGVVVGGAVGVGAGAVHGAISGWDTISKQWQQFAERWLDPAYGK